MRIWEVGSRNAEVGSPRLRILDLGFWIKITDGNLHGQVACCEFRVAGCGLRVASCGLRDGKRLMAQGARLAATKLCHSGSVAWYTILDR